jgi:hypothetical protein
MASVGGGGVFSSLSEAKGHLSSHPTCTKNTKIHNYAHEPPLNIALSPASNAVNIRAPRPTIFGILSHLHLGTLPSVLFNFELTHQKLHATLVFAEAITVILNVIRTGWWLSLHIHTRKSSNAQLTYRFIYSPFSKSKVQVFVRFIPAQTHYSNDFTDLPDHSQQEPTISFLCSCRIILPPVVREKVKSEADARGI